MALTEEQKKERSKFLEQNLEITECSQRKPYVFVSYASNDWETVFKTAVIPMQKQYGARIYADKAFEKVNDRWIVPMLRNIRGADVILSFVSQSYIESYACFLEILTAVNNRKPIVFVYIDETLHLGDTTDQPMIERGAKNEILNQGSTLSTNTNNTSNDIMRAMKSAFTSISTLLEQDALSKYDISDAFISFFRDAEVNRKSLHDLSSIKSTVSSISKNVFDSSLIKTNFEEPTSADTASAKSQPADYSFTQSGSDDNSSTQSQPADYYFTESRSADNSFTQPRSADYSFTESAPAGSAPNKKGMLPIKIIAIIIAVILLIAVPVLIPIVLIILAVAALVKKSKKSKKEPNYSFTEPAPAESAPKKKGMLFIKIIAIIIAVILLIAVPALIPIVLIILAVAALVKKSKKSKKEPKNNQNPR